MTKEDKGLQEYVMYIAMAVRNEMEDFHSKNLSDEQMRELNPIIRNAIYTALYAFDHYDKDLVSRSFVDFQLRLIPDYWELPQLSESFKKDLNDKEHKKRLKELYGDIKSK